MANSKMESIDVVRLVHEHTESIKRISGFAKHHRIPNSICDSEQRFIADISKRELNDDLQKVFKSLRTAYGLKRKEISVTGPSDGVGVITTPYFDYEFHVIQNQDDPSKVVWMRKIAEIKEPARIFAGPFAEVFGNRFSILEFSTTQSLDLESIVDHIEEAELDTVTVDFDKDLSWCEIDVEETACSVLIRDDSIRVISSSDVTPQGLLESFLRIQQEFITTLDLSRIPFLAEPPRTS